MGPLTFADFLAGNQEFRGSRDRSQQSAFAIIGILARVWAGGYSPSMKFLPQARKGGINFQEG
ncbi:MAG: hypothetical protein HC900_04890 [Methylacidiphilales bacterium]|nr:hypothetical protein [Candidatus Methylacidiphilales bacterium]